MSTDLEYIEGLYQAGEITDSEYQQAKAANVENNPEQFSKNKNTPKAPNLDNSIVRRMKERGKNMRFAEQQNLPGQQKAVPQGNMIKKRPLSISKSKKELDRRRKVATELQTYACNLNPFYPLKRGEKQKLDKAIVTRIPHWGTMMLSGYKLSVRIDQNNFLRLIYLARKKYDNPRFTTNIHEINTVIPGKYKTSKAEYERIRESLKRISEVKMVYDLKQGNKRRFKVHGLISNIDIKSIGTESSSIEIRIDDNFYESFDDPEVLKTYLCLEDKEGLPDIAQALYVYTQANKGLIWHPIETICTACNLGNKVQWKSRDKINRGLQVLKDKKLIRDFHWDRSKIKVMIYSKKRKSADKYIEEQLA